MVYVVLVTNTRNVLHLIGYLGNGVKWLRMAPSGTCGQTHDLAFCASSTKSLYNRLLTVYTSGSE
jgi:hypothetical protein